MMGVDMNELAVYRFAVSSMEACVLGDDGGHT